MKGPCWWFEYVDTYLDLQRIIDRSRNLSQDELIEALEDAHIRALAHKPSIATFIARSLVEQYWLWRVLTPPKIEPMNVERMTERMQSYWLRYKPRPKKGEWRRPWHQDIRLPEPPQPPRHLQLEDVWTHGSTWWAQAHVIWTQQHFS
jgi:hypothetical protein